MEKKKYHQQISVMPNPSFLCVCLGETSISLKSLSCQTQSLPEGLKRRESRAPPWALQLGKLGFGANLEEAWLKCPGLIILLMLQEQERCQPAPVITSVGLACD